MNKYCHLFQSTFQYLLLIIGITLSSIGCDDTLGINCTDYKINNCEIFSFEIKYKNVKSVKNGDKQAMDFYVINPLNTIAMSLELFSM